MGGGQPIGEGPRAPVAFVWIGRPLSANKRIGTIGERIMREIRDAYLAAGGSWSDQQRYGIVYHFVRGYRPATDADAGNIGKRVWDALEDAAYDDDQLVRLQHSGVVEIGATSAGDVSYEELDLTAVPANALQELLNLVAAGTERSFLYVETGVLHSAMSAFNLASRGGSR